MFTIIDIRTQYEHNPFCDPAMKPLWGGGELAQYLMGSDPDVSPVVLREKTERNPYDGLFESLGVADAYNDDPLSLYQDIITKIDGNASEVLVLRLGAGVVTPKRIRLFRSQMSPENTTFSASRVAANRHPAWTKALPWGSRRSEYAGFATVQVARPDPFVVKAARAQECAGSQWLDDLTYKDRALVLLDFKTWEIGQHSYVVCEDQTPPPLFAAIKN